MNGWSALDRFLRTDPRDVGCAEAMEMLHVYVELVAADASAAQRYPGIAAHLRACGPCAEDFEGLLAAVAGPGPVAVAPSQHCFAGGRRVRMLAMDGIHDLGGVQGFGTVEMAAEELLFDADWERRAP